MTETIEQVPQVSPEWLSLREAADGAARAGDLIRLVRAHVAGASPALIHDFGCGTGSMVRWLAPQLTGAQRWILHDRDPDLLEHAAARAAVRSADGAPVTVETRLGDVSDLTAADLAGATLVTASALLDLLTADEIERIAAACVAAHCPAFFTISVLGRVELTPPDPLDSEIMRAFNEHQCRTIGDRRLLGPSAVDVTVDAFTRRGIATVVSPSPWRLGAGDAGLAAEWFTGWLGAAVEQRPDLHDPAAAYAQRRRAEVIAGRLGVVVHHDDLLALCQ
jgi:SAM-dependent methyltransferase